MKRLHIFALLFLTLLVLDEAFTAYHKSSKEGKKKKKIEGESREGKKKHDNSPKQQKRKTREVPAEIEESENDLEIEENDSPMAGKEKRKYRKEEAKPEKCNKMNKQSEEACSAKDKKKSGKKYKECKDKIIIQDEVEDEGTDYQTTDEQVYVTKGKRKSTKKMVPNLKQKYNGVKIDNKEKRRGKISDYQDYDAAEAEEEADVDVPRVERYIEETMEEETEVEGNELISEDKCYA